MSTYTTFDARTLHVPATPRGARIAAALFARLVDLLPDARAPRTPAAAPQRRRSRGHDAQQVRRLAQSVQHTDPGFAADLYAAAARHEGAD